MHHDHAIAVVGVRNGKGFLAQTVEKHLFRVAVILETAVVVEMVAGKVGEEGAFEVQTADAVLMDGV